MVKTVGSGVSIRIKSCVDHAVIELLAIFTDTFSFHAWVGARLSLGEGSIAQCRFNARRVSGPGRPHAATDSSW